MGVRTLIGTADATEPAAAMYDSQSGTVFGPLFKDDEHGEAAEQIDGLLEWLRTMRHVELAEEIGLGPSDVPGVHDGTDARHWPESGLLKVAAYYRREVWPVTRGD